MDKCLKDLSPITPGSKHNQSNPNEKIELILFTYTYLSQDLKRTRQVDFVKGDHSLAHMDVGLQKRDYTSPNDETAFNYNVH